MSARILVINDDDDILQTFRIILEEEGYEVITHTFVITNMSEIQHYSPDLIILDLMFGRQNLGWTLLQKLRMFPGTVTIPVILCTAASREVTEQLEHLRSKQIPVLLKPFDLDELLAAVRQQLTSYLPQLLAKAEVEASPPQTMDEEE